MQPVGMHYIASMENPLSTAQETKEERIQRLLSRIDAEECTSRGKSLDEQRLCWQKKPGLRYVVGPFMAGQLFDLWQWALGRIDTFLWRWAKESVSGPPLVNDNHATTIDPRASLRQALKEKKREPH